MSPKKNLCLFANITVAPEKVSDFLEALRPCWDAVLKEPECLYFDVFIDTEQPGKFRFVEIWAEDRTWFETKQLTKSYYGPYMEKTQPMWAAMPKLEYYEREPGWLAFTDNYLESGKKVAK